MEKIEQAIIAGLFEAPCSNDAGYAEQVASNAHAGQCHRKP